MRRSHNDVDFASRPSTRLRSAGLPASHAPVDCPHCATPKVTFSLVTPTDKPRNYGESPSTKVHLERLRSQTTAGHAVR